MSEPNHLYHQALSSNRKLLAELTDRKAEADRLKAENERLRASSFVTAVPVEEYDKLKAEVERLKVNSGLDQKTIRNLQQTPEWSEIARLTADYRALEAQNARLQGLAMIREGRLAVPYDYEQLREENARLRAELTDLKSEADRLKAEVERLNSKVERLRDAGENLVVAWAKVRTDKGYIAWVDATEYWDKAKEGKPSV